jgi:hypothetical protein
MAAISRRSHLKNDASHNAGSLGDIDSIRILRVGVDGKDL